MHPFSVAECLNPELKLQNYQRPAELNGLEWNALWEFGGFPEPFLRRDKRFSRRWHSLRHNQLLREDVRALTRIQELEQLDSMALILERRSGEQLVYSRLAREVRVSENTVRAWISTLSSLHFGFLVKPWFRNVSKAIRKEPKWFLRDWSMIEDEGQRVETFIACHLLKAVEGWSDLGLGKFELFYIRDKQKREVDFLVTRDADPWFIVEAKKDDTSLSPALDIMQKQTGALHAFQVVFEEDYVDADCFKYKQPVVVPARTFLSQLL